MTFNQYMEVYDKQIDWYDYFNSNIKPITKAKRIFNINQV